ncbi:MAG TPA: NADH-quinone oxidoreductase subunit NuoH [Blastocatellia bacterium]|nr:NADH-quinone oxidoreductase subunit NuoH [Blastocatellia bacterium]
MIDTLQQWLSNPFIFAIVKIAIVFGVVLTAVAYMSLAERKVLGWMQMRPGPNRVGPWGFLQPAADGLKFILKEDIVPSMVNKFAYILAPMVAIVPALMAFAVIPFGPTVRGIDLHITALNVGLLYLFAITSVSVYGIVLAGWSSNSKYPLIGGLRSSAQMVSYELALSLSIIGVLLQANTLDLSEIVRMQSGWHWYIWWYQPIGFVIFFIASLAETNRIPFDLPEAETELVGGFHTEYSSMKFAMFFMAEYANLVTAAALATTLFFGGWNGPFVDKFPILGLFYFVIKVGIFLFIHIWVRATLPRYRYDQLMNFGWKVLLPLALVNLVLSATIRTVQLVYYGG